MDHETIRRSIAAYALDAMDTSERAEVEHELLQHVPGCDECLAMLRDFRDVAADLALAAGSRDVDAGLEDRVLNAIHSLPATRTTGSRRRRLVIRSASVAALVALAASWTLSASLLGRVHDADRVKAGRIFAMEQVLRAIHDPSARMTAFDGGSGILVASSGSDGRIMLFGEGIASPGPGRVLQLWLMRDGVPVPSATFVPDSGHVLVRTQVAIADYQGLAVTVERGAEKRPTTAPIYSGVLSA